MKEGAKPIDKKSFTKKLSLLDAEEKVLKSSYHPNLHLI